MRTLYAYVLVAILSWVGAASSQSIVLGLSKQEIGITAFFDGSEILIFGALKHQNEASSAGKLDVVITIASPRIPVTVRRKEKRYGVWVNVDALEIDLAPSFYAVATSGPFDQVVSPASDLWHQISVQKMILAVSGPEKVENSEDFTEAVVRIRENEGLYQTLTGAVTLQNQTLFSASVTLPANLVEGAYTARIFLMSDGDVIAKHQTAIDVRKVGIERWLYNLAHQRPVVYGLLSLAIAIFAGWAAATAFRAVRG